MHYYYQTTNVISEICLCTLKTCSYKHLIKHYSTCKGFFSFEITSVIKSMCYLVTNHHTNATVVQGPGKQIKGCLKFNQVICQL